MTVPYQEDDTIVAPATPPGVGALAVVRVSGPAAIRIADAVFRGRTAPSRARPRTALHGKIVDEGERPIDEALLILFPAPRSYTGEDVVEISCHGGPWPVRAVVERLIRAGARAAAPGEFTRRAFRNGRIDLAQAESVADLVRARTEGAARTALRQLGGELSGALRAMRGRAVDLLARVEADLDFADEERFPAYDREEARRIVEEVRREAERLAGEGERGRVLVEGVGAALVGRPNSGKSTLFNALLGEERAIVSPEPGTTRDLLEGEAAIGGLLFRLSDTAGMREAPGAVEEEGVRRARRRSGESDVRIVVLDRSEPLTDEDMRVLAETAGAARVVALTKSDLPDRAGPPPLIEGERAVNVSGLTGDGVEDLRAALLAAVEGEETAKIGDAVISGVRHLEAVRAAERALSRALQSIDRGELLAEDLREAASQIGSILGEGTREEVLDRIFQRFCIGK
ncbi:MAG: tRNA uridine-5-carboxymethylaminomethyl(34) synthesis GTPase MnmE [Candidatus Eisenbacteria bacterium]|nr:tRNA uridine-5-carboxymethylaminomethyl(34) synthesis GTPase MnmE [Candidatus Eisenbacteria bacterium]